LPITPLLLPLPLRVYTAFVHAVLVPAWHVNRRLFWLPASCDEDAMSEPRKAAHAGDEKASDAVHDPVVDAPEPYRRPSVISAAQLEGEIFDTRYETTQRGLKSRLVPPRAILICNVHLTSGRTGMPK